MDATVAELAAVPLFSSLDEAELSAIAGWFDVRAVSEGVRVAGEGAPGYFFFVLGDGTASVTLDGEEIATLGPGDFFGEMSLLGAGRRTATVTTTSPARLLVLFGTDFRKLQQQLPEAAARIEAAMHERAARAAP
jgi:CRP/FNR family transcriptional regulator, cyclic AMP receptor protein